MRPRDPPRGADASCRSIYVFTHDSVFLGEDGPTHQPVEHSWALRLIPNLDVLRPADALETARVGARARAHATGPTALALTRQKLPALPRTRGSPRRRSPTAATCVVDAPSALGA